MGVNTSTPIRHFSDLTGALKATARQGWLDYQIDAPESVWEHMAHVAKLGPVLAQRFLPQLESGFNPTRCRPLGFFHDLTEAIVPDVTPAMPINKAQKRWLETTAIDYIGTLSKAGAVAKHYWLEFEHGLSPEARFMQKVDALHIAYIGLRYEQEDRTPYALTEFWNYVKRKVENHPLEIVFHELAAQRPPGADNKPPYPESKRKIVTFDQAASNLYARMGRAAPTVLPTLS